MPRPAHPRRTALAAAGVVASLAVTGCTGDGGDGGSSEPVAAAGTPLAALDTSLIAVARAPFCDRLSTVVVERALGGRVADATSYGNGDRAEIVPGVKDVAHEFSCTFTATDGTTARAWLFVPPITQDRAAGLAKAATAADGCTEVEGAARFGDPSAAVQCLTRTGDRLQGTTVTYQGLFGDAWLACSLAVPGDTVRVDQGDQASRWCAAVVAAAASSG
ncbi:MAG: hypothetical protein U0R78_08150 [Nocardioidaceae bacterium]